MRAASLLVVLAACGRPDVVVICHNANCVSPRDMDADDTIPTLEAALALGPAVLDGMELDLSWVRAEARCVFAHDLRDGPWPDAAEAVDRVAAYLRAYGPAAGHSDRFHVMIELKRAVDGDGTRHTDAERRDFAECALDAYDVIRAAALETAQPLGVIFDGFEPDLFRALTASARWPGAARDGLIQVRLAAAFSIPEPLHYSHTLDDFTGVDLDVVDVHPRFTTPADRRVYDGLGYEVSLWTEGVDPELFDALASDPPAYTVVSDAPLVRAWIDE